MAVGRWYNLEFLLQGEHCHVSKLDLILHSYVSFLCPEHWSSVKIGGLQIGSA